MSAEQNEQPAVCGMCGRRHPFVLRCGYLRIEKGDTWWKCPACNRINGLLTARCAGCGAAAADAPKPSNADETAFAVQRVVRSRDLEPRAKAEVAGAAEDTSPYWLTYTLAEFVSDIYDECLNPQMPCRVSSKCVTEYCAPCAARWWMEWQGYRARVSMEADGAQAPNDGESRHEPRD